MSADFLERDEGGARRGRCGAGARRPSRLLRGGLEPFPTRVIELQRTNKSASVSRWGVRR